MRSGILVNKMRKQHLPNVNEAGWAARSWVAGLYTMVWSSTHCHATWSFANCSLLFNGLNLTVTTIFSSFALWPPGVDAGVLSTFEAGVPGVLINVILIRYKTTVPKESNTRSAVNASPPESDVNKLASE